MSTIAPASSGILGKEFEKDRPPAQPVTMNPTAGILVMRVSAVVTLVGSVESMSAVADSVVEGHEY